MRTRAVIDPASPVDRLERPSADRPTRIELELRAPPSLSEADVVAFHDAAQRFVGRVQIRGS